MAISLLIFNGGCGPQASSAGGPQAWIDAPLEGMQLPLAPYEIVAHADDPSGIAQFEFNVNGNVIANTAGGPGSLSTVPDVESDRTWWLCAHRPRTEWLQARGAEDA